MSHCKNTPGFGRKLRVKQWEERGYGVENLGNSLVRLFIPEKDEHHFSYISAPFNGDVEQYAALVGYYAQKAWDEKSIPVNPYLMFSAMFPGRRAEALNFVMILSFMILMHCDELWIVGCKKDDLCEHLAMEVNTAEHMHIPVRYMSFDEEEDGNE